MARYGTVKEAELLSKLAKEAELGIVEIGVLDGETTKILLENSTVKVYGIDPLIPDSMNKNLIGHYNDIHNNTKQFGSRFVFYKDYSYNIAKTFQELKEPVDLVFIDGDHNYEAVKQDFLNWWNIIDKGVILLHDSRPLDDGSFNGHDGPKKLVSELNNCGYTPYITCDTITGYYKRKESGYLQRKTITNLCGL